MTNSVKIALIISLGIVTAAIISNAMDYYMANKMMNESNQQIKTLTKQFNQATPTPSIEKSPTYEKVWVPGKSLKECMKGSTEINETVNRCRNGYYREIRTH